jgi:hypothetical protein
MNAIRDRTQSEVTSIEFLEAVGAAALASAQDDPTGPAVGDRSSWAK